MTNNIDSLTIDEIQSLLEKKRAESPDPIPLPNPDFKELIKFAQEYVECVKNKTTLNKQNTMIDFFIIGMRSIYGEDIVGWIFNNAMHQQNQSKLKKE